MKPMKELMQELGWEDEATSETAKAFIKNLIRAANETPRPIALKPTEQRSNSTSKNDSKKKPMEQLSFDFSQSSSGKQSG